MTLTYTEPAEMSHSQRPAERSRQTPERRRRHLMDPNAPRPVHDAEAERQLRNVQRWIMSSLAVVTILHMSGGLIAAAIFLPEPTLAAEIGLNVIAGAFASVALGSWLAIHGRSLLSRWLPVAFLLTAGLGLALTLR
jgi:hypothetical protein